MRHLVVLLSRTCGHPGRGRSDLVQVLWETFSKTVNRHIMAPKLSIRTALANFVESNLGCTSRIYFDNVTLTLHNVTLTSHKQYHHNNKYDCNKTNVYKYSL